MVSAKLSFSYFLWSVKGCDIHHHFVFHRLQLPIHPVKPTEVKCVAQFSTNLSAPWKELQIPTHLCRNRWIAPIRMMLRFALKPSWHSLANFLKIILQCSARRLLTHSPVSISFHRVQCSMAQHKHFIHQWTSAGLSLPCAVSSWWPWLLISRMLEVCSQTASCFQTDLMLQLVKVSYLSSYGYAYIIGHQGTSMFLLLPHWSYSYSVSLAIEFRHTLL